MIHKHSQRFEEWILDRDVILSQLYSQANMLFEHATATGHMRSCDFNGDRWEAPVAALIFDRAKGVSGEYFPIVKKDRQTYCDSQCVQLLKSYVSTKLKKSQTQRNQHLAAAKLVLHLCGDRLDGLFELSEKRLADFMRHYSASGYGSASGLDNRLAGPKGFITWLRDNNLLPCPFKYSRVVHDTHDLAKKDATSPAAAEKVNNKRPPPNLDVAIGEIISKTEEGQNEPKPGYFRLRAICATFMMAAGLRFGEAATLQIDCFYESNGRTWLKVLSEKSGVPRLVPLGAGWESLLKMRHAEALELTKEARQYAKDLEDGKYFVKQRKILEKVRSRVSKIRYEEAGTEFLLRPENGYFQWSSYAELGLLPRWFDRLTHPLRLKAVIGHKGRNSAWLAFDLFESYVRDQFERELSNHFSSAIENVNGVNVMLRRSGYEVDAPLSKHLFVVAEDQFHACRPSKPMHPMPLNLQAINRFLRTGSSHVSAFKALNIRSSNGKIFELNDGVSSHVFRHWKDDARFRSGCNETAMALLSGRKPTQNRAYDKRTPSELAEQHRSLYLQSIESLLPDDPLGKQVKKMIKVGATREEIERRVNETLQILHLTPWSGCSRDLDREPCPKHYKCLRGFTDQTENDSTCPNLHIDPTDLVAKENIELQLRVSKYQLASLERLCGEEEIKNTLTSLDLEYAPQRGRSILEMQMRHQYEIIRGCEAALRTYETSNAGNHQTRNGKRLRQIASMDRIRTVNLIDPKDMRQ